MHSPGPWKLLGPVHCSAGIIPGMSKQIFISRHMTHSLEEEKQYHDDLKLMAAAPSLLEALDSLQANPNDPRAHRVAMDAMKLARGA